MDVQEVDDDENTPMRPGEEVPPLDTVRCLSTSDCTCTKPF